MKTYFELGKIITAEHMKNLQADPLLARRLDKSVENVLEYAEKLVAALPEIDLRGRNLDVRYEYQGERVGWMAWDDNSYDGAPDGNNCLGFGEEKEDALADLLEKMDVEPEPKPRMPRLVHSSQDSPPEHKADAYKDPDDIDFDDGLTDDDAR